MDIVKGQEYQVLVKFSNRGNPAVFDISPAWTLYNNQDQVIVSGQASPSGNQWEATFTVPTNYVVPGGKENLILQFVAKDNSNRTYTSDKHYSLVDFEEGFAPNGLVYDAINNSSIVDTIIDQADTITSANIKLIDPLGNEVVPEVIVNNLTPNSKTSYGNMFKVTVSNINIEKNKYYDPYNLVITYSTSNGIENLIRPVYILDLKTAQIVHSLKLLIDKAQLVEIDPSLQWQLPELIAAVLEGLKYINAHEPEQTFWTLINFPTSLNAYLTLAAQMYALEMRVMAEGLNAFEFSGLNTNLSYNRTDFLSGKIGEIQSKLDRLTPSKRSAINVAGKGTPPVGEDDNRLANLAAIGLTVNSLNGYVSPYHHFRRFRRF